MDRKSQLESNLSKVLGEIKGRATLIAVSKTFPFSDVEILLKAGHKDFGENKVQDLEEKALLAQQSSLKVNWHFIGHLQSNKAKKLLQIPQLKAIHSIDSIKLLKQLMKYENELTAPVDCFLQVNTSLEEQKSGFTELPIVRQALEIMSSSKNLQPRGLMTIGNIRTNNFEADAKECFAKLISYRDQLNPALKLSMGMSSDYQIALEYHCDFVRVGSKIFGSRNI